MSDELIRLARLKTISYREGENGTPVKIRANSLAADSTSGDDDDCLSIQGYLRRIKRALGEVGQSPITARVSLSVSAARRIFSD